MILVAAQLEQKQAFTLLKKAHEQLKQNVNLVPEEVYYLTLQLFEMQHHVMSLYRISTHQTKYHNRRC